MNSEKRWTTKNQPHPIPLTLSIWHRVNDGQNSKLSPPAHNLVCSTFEQCVHCLSVRLSGISIYDAIGYEIINPQDCVAWENSRHFTTPLLGSLRNDVWENSAEIPYLWRVTTQIWEVRLIGYKIASTNQKHYPYLGSDASSDWLRQNFSQSDTPPRFG